MFVFVNGIFKIMEDCLDMMRRIRHIIIKESKLDDPKVTPIPHAYIEWRSGFKDDKITVLH